MSGEIGLSMWVIYERPKDYPRHFVVRRHVVGKKGGPKVIITVDMECQLADSLEEARKLVPQGLVNIGRSSQDEAQIVEVWV